MGVKPEIGIAISGQPLAGIVKVGTGGAELTFTTITSLSLQPPGVVAVPVKMYCPGFKLLNDGSAEDEGEVAGMLDQL